MILALFILAEWVSPEKQREFFRKAFGEYFNRGYQVPVRYMLLAVMGLVLLLTLLWAHRWIQDQRKHPLPIFRFLQMAWALRLGLTRQWFLIRIAKQQRLPNPITLLLSGSTLWHHAQRYALSQPTWRRSAILASAAAIHTDLFGPAPAAEEISHR